jgi:glycosyltransferase involved in cell wall biosynthesis
MTTAEILTGTFPPPQFTSPLVSVLIPAYNAEKWIRQCIQSALDQFYSPIEIIVVDDGSSDGTVEEILKFGDRIKLIRGQHAGANASRNLLTQAARGEWLQYLDADDYLLPNKVADQIRFLRGHDVCDVIYSPTIIRREDTRTESVTVIEPPYDELVHFVRWIPFCTHGMLLRRSAVLHAGSWKEDQPVCQEHELVFRLICNGCSFSVWNQPGTVYRHHSANTVSTKNPLRTVQMRMNILDRFENWLIDSGRMTPIHRKEIYAARMDTARVAWSIDEAYSMILARKGSSHGHFWVSGRSALPLGFQVLCRTAGFRASQKFAGVVRAAGASRSAKTARAYSEGLHRGPISPRA